MASEPITTVTPRSISFFTIQKIIAPNVSLSACRNSVRDCVAAVHPSELHGIEIQKSRGESYGSMMQHAKCRRFFQSQDSGHMKKK